MVGMRRRDFTLLGGAAMAWPLAARAQRPRRIAALMGTVETAPDALGLKEVLNRLKALGWSDGTTAHIDVRWSRSDLTVMREKRGSAVGRRAGRHPLPLATQRWR